ncbi:MAG TPA: hypothetical protein PKA57_13760 [Parvibaculum sp.]|nr:hypothetical protein [Parvibaculum sp.]HMM15687.1 hypothetical protein [Parvibaculum sp.]
MSSAMRLLAVFAVFAVVILGGVIYLGQSAEPSVQNVEKVLPDGQFPR